MLSPRITRLLSSPSPRALDEFWAGLAGGTPLVEPWDDESVLVTFLWRGRARATRTWWGVGVPLKPLPGSDLWAGSRVLPADLRTIYCLLHDDAERLPAGTGGGGDAHVDTYNPRLFPFPADPDDPDDFDQWASVLELPAAPAEPWTDPRPGVPAGSITPAVLPGTDRRLAVYRPAGVPAEGLPVLVMFDGYAAREVLRVPTVLDNLIAAGRIPPLVAVFVSSFCATREEELTPGPALASFARDHLMPWIRRTLAAGTDPRANLVAGVSRGGLAAAYLGLCVPGLFGGVIAQSGSFWWPSPAEGAPQWLVREVAARPLADVRFYLDCGVREDMPGPGGAPAQIDVCRNMRDALRARGYPVEYAEYSGGHDYINWRRTFADGLVAVSGVRLIGK